MNKGNCIRFLSGKSGWPLVEARVAKIQTSKFFVPPPLCYLVQCAAQKARVDAISAKFTTPSGNSLNKRLSWALQTYV
jgi:hypothetical protein